MSAYYKRMKDGKFMIILNEMEANHLVKEVKDSLSPMLGSIATGLPKAIAEDVFYTNTDGVAPPEEPTAHAHIDTETLLAKAINEIFSILDKEMGATPEVAMAPGSPPARQAVLRMAHAFLNRREELKAVLTTLITTTQAKAPEEEPLEVNWA